MLAKGQTLDMSMRIAAGMGRTDRLSECRQRMGFPEPSRLPPSSPLKKLRLTESDVAAGAPPAVGGQKRRFEPTACEAQAATRLLQRAAREWAGAVRTLYLFGLIGFCIMGCREDTPVRARVVNLNVFAMYSVRPSSDDVYTVAVTDPAGVSWYRAQAPGLDLGDIELSQVRAALDSETGGGVVVVPVKPEHYEMLSSWSRARIGSSVVFVYQDRVVGQPITLEHEVRGMVSVRVPSAQEAEHLAAQLRQYGE